MSNGSGSPSTAAGTSEYEKGTSSAPYRQGAPPEVLDERKTTSWAIASVGSGGFIVGVSQFLLVNRETGREHTMWVTTGGLTTPFGVASAGTPSYTLFETSRAVSFDDFDKVGVRLTSANIGVFFGYSIVYLTIWNGPIYVSDQIAYVKMTGWAAMIPGGSVAHGVTKILYGSGGRSGTVQLVIAPEVDDYVREPPLVRIRMAAQESPRIPIPGDLLFEFDSASLKPDSEHALLYLADLLNNRKRLPIDIEGHTDSIGPDTYNLTLSRKRAQAVKNWLVQHRVYRAKEFRVLPYGETRPAVPNTKPDGSDDPEGRRQNRRVVVKGEWNI